MRQKVIYSNVTPLNQDSEEHYREKIMLYTHWRDDEKDLKNDFTTFEERYNSKLTEIPKNKAQYVKLDESFYDKLACHIEAEQLQSNIHPEAQHHDLIDFDDLSSRPECFDPRQCVSEQENYDIGEDLGISRR